MEKTKKYEKAIETIKVYTGYALKLAIIIFFAVVSVRIALSDFALDLTKFDFSDFLALILALFAMGMSVAFYFKSTDSSNSFYNSFNDFTQKNSELLGRIEERFGKDLENIRQINRRMEDNYYKTTNDVKNKVEETEVLEESQEKRIKEIEIKITEFMESFSSRNNIDQEEKELFKSVIEKLNNEKIQAKTTLKELENEKNEFIQTLKDSEKHYPIPNLTTNDIDWLSKFICETKYKTLLDSNAPYKKIKNYYNNNNYLSKDIDILMELGIINNEFKFTIYGYYRLKGLYEKYNILFI